MRKYLEASRATLTVGGLLLGCIGSPAQSQEGSGPVAPIDVIIMAAPFAGVELLSSGALSLNVPSPGSTLPWGDGFGFRVTGNARAQVTAAPDFFVQVPGEGSIGRAIHDGGELGYSVMVEFPKGSGQFGGLISGDGTYPVAANLAGFDSVEGEIHLISNPFWTPDGELALPGVYEGRIVLTVIAMY